LGFATNGSSGLIETLFRALILFQPLIWIWVLEDRKFLDVLNDVNFDFWFRVLVSVFCMLVISFNFSIGFYSGEILVVYALIVWMGFEVIHQVFRYDFREALALSFLITFMNSWYWEGVLHVWAIQENGLNLNQLFQLVHLLPGLYFLKQWTFDVKGSTREILNGWVAAGLITFTRKARLWKYLPMVHTDLSVYRIDHGLMILNRLICFWFLLNAVIRFGMRKRDYPKFYKQ
jgi:hypothetical protein